MEDQVVETLVTELQAIDFQPLIDSLIPYFIVFVVCFGIVIALLIVLIFAKGFQSNAR